MKKHLIKAGVLFAVFIAALVTFSRMMNNETAQSASDMVAPTYPTICMVLQDTKVNQMFGYSQEMDVSYVRDSVTPVTATRDMKIAVRTFGGDIRSITYEVRNISGDKVFENAKISNFTEDGEYRLAEFKLQNAIRLNQEYSLKFTVDIAGKPVYYYTRIVQRAGINASVYLEFVQNFYQRCMNKENAADLEQYLENGTKVNDNSFNNVDINSSSEQLTWGDMSPQIYRAAIPCIKEINETTGSLVLDYMITARDENDNNVHYNVRDFYRLSYAQSKIKLLDFERAASQIFDANTSVIKTSGIDLGISSRDVEYAQSEDSCVIAFVKEGDLYLYNSNVSKLTKVFGFSNRTDADERDNLRMHGVKTISVDNNGNVDFMVYGYMNEDVHEGMTGISVYHFNSVQNSIDERVFIPIRRSYEFMKNDIENLSYVSSGELVYLFFSGSLISVNLADSTYKVVNDNIPSENFHVSKSQRYVAWMNTDETGGGSEVTILDLETLSTNNITSQPGQKIKGIGFINEHFLYGLADEVNITVDEAGNVFFPMVKLVIQEFGGKVVREYNGDGFLVVKADIREGLVDLARVAAMDGMYTPISNDKLINNLQESNGSISVSVSNDAIKGEIVSLDFASPVSDTKPMIAFSRMLVNELRQDLQIDIKDNIDNMYKVFGFGKFSCYSASAGEAINLADSQMGVVIASDNQYIWERGNRDDKHEIPYDYIPEPVRTMSLSVKALEESMGEDYTIMNLTGCSLNSILYLVGQDRPVIARLSPEETVIIVGYDQFNTKIIRQGSTQSEYMAMDESESQFASCGNVFISYMEKIKEES